MPVTPASLLPSSLVPQAALPGHACLVSAAPCCLPRLSTGKEKGGACPVARFPGEPPPPRVPQPSPLHWTQSLPKPWGHRPRSSPITGQCPEQGGSFQPRRTCRALFSCRGTCRSRSSPGHIPAAPGLPGSSVPSKPVLPAPPTGLRQPQGARNEWNVLGPGRGGGGGGSMGVGHQPDGQGDPICPQTICVHPATSTPEQAQPGSKILPILAALTLAHPGGQRDPPPNTHQS